MEGAGADFHVVWLQDHAALARPIGLQRQDQVLEGEPAVRSVAVGHGTLTGAFVTAFCGCEKLDGGPVRIKKGCRGRLRPGGVEPSPATGRGGVEYRSTTGAACAAGGADAEGRHRSEGRRVGKEGVGKGR